MNFERRVITASLRAVGNDYHEPPTLRGYAARFNSLSDDLGGFRERIAPGAFTKALQEDHDVRFLFNHNPDAILGRTTSGTLKLSQDDKGLAFECVLPETQTARDVWSSVSRRDIDQCSFAFSSPEDDWDEDEDERGKRFIRRTLRSMNLHDVSCVTYPAYKDTSVNARDNGGLIIVRATIPEQLRVKPHTTKPIGEPYLKIMREETARLERAAHAVDLTPTETATLDEVRRRYEDDALFF